MAIFLLLQFASSNSFGEQLIKLPALFAHFNHHAREHHDTKNFFDFLQRHYAPHNDKDIKDHSGDDDHDDLPFKHCHNQALHAITLGFLPSALNTNFQQQPARLAYFFENDRITNLESNSIWQPPKLG